MEDKRSGEAGKGNGHVQLAYMTAREESCVEHIGTHIRSRRRQERLR